MNSTPDALERPRNPTQFGGDGLYDSTGAVEHSDAEQGTSLKVQLGEHLDGATRGSLQAAEGSASSIFEFARRHPISILVAVGGIAAIFAALNRRGRW
jgi:hypothetical protein